MPVETCGQLTCMLTFCAGSEECYAEPSCARAMVLPFEEWVSLAHPHVGGSPPVLAGLHFPSFDDREPDSVDWLLNPFFVIFDVLWASKWRLA
jgi:hypothetical protein